MVEHCHEIFLALGSNYSTDCLQSMNVSNILRLALSSTQCYMLNCRIFDN